MFAWRWTARDSRSRSGWRPGWRWSGSSTRRWRPWSLSGYGPFTSCPRRRCGRTDPSRSGSCRPSSATLLDDPRAVQGRNSRRSPRFAVIDQHLSAVRRYADDCATPDSASSVAPGTPLVRSRRPPPSSAACSRGPAQDPRPGTLQEVVSLAGVAIAGDARAASNSNHRTEASLRNLIGIALE